ncbi:MAG: hypothetical protein V1779_04605 [bacterium]
MNIIKIGGAVLKSQSGFEAMIDILKKYTERPLLIVISAFSKATRDLAKAAKLAEAGNEKEAMAILEKVIDEHLNYARILLKNKDTLESLILLFESSKQRLSEFIKGLSITGELTARTLDAVLSFGEFFALHTVNHYLQEQGFELYCVDSTSLIVSDDNYGNAKPLLKETAKQVKEKLIPKLEENSIVLTQGFVAKNRMGEITTMGIESSNLTASLYAEILCAKSITFWTDVPGLRTADPKIVEQTFPIPALNYSDAYKAATNGLKLIHPKMLEYVSSQNISLIYKSAFEPDNAKTVISAENNEPNKPMIISREDLMFSEIPLTSDKSKEEADSLINKLLRESSDIIKHSVFPESIRIIYKKSSSLEKKLSRNFSMISTLHCSLVTVLNTGHIRHKFVNNKILDKYSEKIINFDCSADSIRMIVLPEITNEIVKELHEFIFEKIK